MLHKTRGIVFKVTDYAESSVVVQIYTEKFGMQSYIINGVKKPRAKINSNMLQPLHLLDLVVYHKNNGSVQRISELKNVPVLQSMPYNMIKTSIALFLNEVLYKGVKQQTADDTQLFNFVFHAIELLDHYEGNLSNFHLVFLVQLTRYLGFYPDNTKTEGADYFDMQNGAFTRYKPENWHYLSPPHTQNFHQLLRYGFEDMQNIKLDNSERRYLLGKLLEYFALHVDGFGRIQSHQILEEVLG